MKQFLMGMVMAGAWVASAHGGPKSYHVRMPEKVAVGGAALDPGDYHVRVEGATAIFLDGSSKEVAKAPVTVKNADRKFEHTEVLYTKRADNAEHLTGLDIGGTKLELEFRN